MSETTGSKKAMQLWLLCGFYPVLLFCSVNWYVFSWPQIGLLFLVIPSAMLAGGAIWLFLSRPLIRSIHKGSPRITNLLLGLPPLILLSVLLKEPLSGMPVSGWMLWGAIALVMAVLMSLVYQKGLKPIIILMVFLNSAAFAHFGYQVLRYAPEGKKLWHTRQRARFEKVVLKQTPNIYFIIAESYPNRRHLGVAQKLVPIFSWTDGVIPFWPLGIMF
ncbi:MAG: hypothetical protein JRJ54_10750, partial [Deltaproteobacteria bacterium]|nr:hypothetical protein [Deltaproteobacteria bacterium]